MFIKDFGLRLFRFLMPCVLALVMFFSYQLLKRDTWQTAFAAFEGEFQQASVSFHDGSLGTPALPGRQDDQGDDFVPFGNYTLSQRRQTFHRLKQDMSYLLTMNGRGVVALFERPELVRSELPTVIWQYRDEHCVLDIYFSVPSGSDLSTAAVSHYELRPRNRRAIQAVTPERCVQSLAYQDSPFSILNVGAIYKSSLER